MSLHDNRRFILIVNILSMFPSCIPLHDFRHHNNRTQSSPRELQYGSRRAPRGPQDCLKRGPRAILSRLATRRNSKKANMRPTFCYESKRPSGGNLTRQEREALLLSTGLVRKLRVESVKRKRLEPSLAIYMALRLSCAPYVLIWPHVLCPYLAARPMRPQHHTERSHRTPRETPNETPGNTHHAKQHAKHHTKRSSKHRNTRKNKNIRNTQRNTPRKPLHETYEKRHGAVLWRLGAVLGHVGAVLDRRGPSWPKTLELMKTVC